MNTLRTYGVRHPKKKKKTSVFICEANEGMNKYFFSAICSIVMVD